MRLASVRNDRDREYVVMADGIELGSVPDRMLLLGVRAVEIDWVALRASMGLPATG
jgi:hypothetical protein